MIKFFTSQRELDEYLAFVDKQDKLLEIAARNAAKAVDRTVKKLAEKQKRKKCCGKCKKK